MITEQHSLFFFPPPSLTMPAVALKGKVEYGVFGDAGVGVYANDDVEAEETVCAVPVRLCLSYPVAYEWAKPFLWFEPESKVHKGDCRTQRLSLLTATAVLIYLLFMNERFFNPNSFWKPFFGSPYATTTFANLMLLDALPDEYPLPLFWGEKALALLKGTPMRGSRPPPLLASLA